MTESHAVAEVHAAPPAEPQFIPEELVEFKADDTEAGKNIGRMLVAGPGTVIHVEPNGGDRILI